MNKICVLNLSEEIKNKIPENEFVGYDFEHFSCQEKLIDYLKEHSCLKVFIVMGKVDNSFIVTISESKLFNHEYYLFTTTKISHFDRNLYFSLGYSNMYNLPLDNKELNLVKSDLNEAQKAA